SATKQTCEASTTKDTCKSYDAVFYVQSDEQPAPPFKMRPAVDTVRAEKETKKGTLMLYIELPDSAKAAPGSPEASVKKVKLSFTNVHIASAKLIADGETTLTPKLSTLTVDRTGSVELRLDNLDPSIKLKIGAQAFDGSDKPI